MSDEYLFIGKGCVALLGFVLLLTHIATTCEYERRQMPRAQRLRYVALLVCSSATAFASQEQIRHAVDWKLRHAGELTGATFILIAAIASVVTDRRNKVKHHVVREAGRGNH